MIAVHQEGSCRAGLLGFSLRHVPHKEDRIHTDWAEFGRQFLIAAK
jgi:hypothetical protein